MASKNPKEVSKPEINLKTNLTGLIYVFPRNFKVKTKGI